MLRRLSYSPHSRAVGSPFPDGTTIGQRMMLPSDQWWRPEAGEWTCCYAVQENWWCGVCELHVQFFEASLCKYSSQFCSSMSRLSSLPLSSTTFWAHWACVFHWAGPALTSAPRVPAAYHLPVGVPFILPFSVCGGRAVITRCLLI